MCNSNGFGIGFTVLKIVSQSKSSPHWLTETSSSSKHNVCVIDISVVR